MRILNVTFAELDDVVNQHGIMRVVFTSSADGNQSDKTPKSSSWLSRAGPSAWEIIYRREILYRSFYHACMPQSDVAALFVLLFMHIL